MLLGNLREAGVLGLSLREYCIPGDFVSSRPKHIALGNLLERTYCPSLQATMATHTLVLT